MNATAILWLSLFTVLTLASLRRPVYAAVANVLVFFANPSTWWFGDGLLTTITTRWSLVACGVLLLANFSTRHGRPAMTPLVKRYCLLIAFLVLNAFFVNSFLAVDPIRSARNFDILWKVQLASLLVLLTLRSAKDIEVLLLAIVACSGFVGYEVIFGGVGGIERGRLEGLVFPGAEGSNGTAGILCFALVVASYFVIRMGNPLYWLTSLACTPLVLETILRCNSRGAYLSLIASGVVLVLLARGPHKKKILLLGVLATVAIVALAKNARIWERFYSIFAEVADRDGAASERLLYWKAALRMIADYPLGSGGEAAFKSPRGMSYIAHFRNEPRSVHNSVLDIAAGWGIQGLTIFASALLYPVYKTVKFARLRLLPIDRSRYLLVVFLTAALVGQVVASCFTSILDGEWVFWITSVCVAITTLPAPAQPEQATHMHTLSNETNP